MTVLTFFGSIYGTVVDIRNHLYERRIFETFDLRARTISIGNITTGGTGKTPLVAYVAEILASRGEKVCILTRGYGRANPKRRVLVSDRENILADPAEAGDEPFELAQKLLGKAITIADADRVAAAEWAKRKFGVTVFVLDDGFQHRRVKRDIDIVCIDATKPFGGREMLPAGRLREPLANLKRAGVIVITRSNLAGEISNLKSEISRLAPDAAVFCSENKITRTADLKDPMKMLSDRDRMNGVFVFCGIGNPNSFYEDLKRSGINPIQRLTFADHHTYSEKDIEKIESAALSCGARCLVTTLKDAVKLADFEFTLPCYVAEMEITLDDETAFAAIL